MKVFAVVDAEGKPFTANCNKGNPWYSRKGHADRACEDAKSWYRRTDVTVKEFTLVPTEEYETLLQYKQLALMA